MSDAGSIRAEGGPSKTLKLNVCAGKDRHRC